MKKQVKKQSKKWSTDDYILVSMASLGIIFLFVFAYLPMLGITLAFKDGDYQLNILNAIFKSEWVGLKNFKTFLTDSNFVDILLNTLGLNVLMLLINFPAPIIFALLLNELKGKKFRGTVQTIANFPHFLSWVTYGGIVIALIDMTTGVVNPLLDLFGLISGPINMQSSQYFWPVIILASLLKGVGWGSIIYLAAIAGINPTIYEAAELDGAKHFHRMFKITLPLIMPTVTVFLLLEVSRLLSNSFEQFYILQNAINLERSEVLATYIYKQAMINRRYSYSAAINVFNSIISLILLTLSNYISKKSTGRGIF